MKRLAVLGTFVWDTIHHPGRPAGEPLEQWGGIAYSLSAFAGARPSGWCIEPIVRVGQDLAGQAQAFLRSMAAICDLQKVRVVPEPNNRVELRYLDEAERTERLSGGIGGWSREEILPLLGGIDALFINFISGFELDLSTAEALRKAVAVPIYCDIHSLCLGPPRDGPRLPRDLEGADRWLATADYVQVNEAELELIGGLPTSGGRTGDRDRTLLVTRGAEGASYWSLAGSDPDAVHVPLAGGALAGDPTGCGDVWGAVAFAGILDGLSMRNAIERAHRAAAAKLSHPRMKGLASAIAAAIQPTA